jgi:DNA-binding YbaB/EbfC family protein
MKGFGPGGLGSMGDLMKQAQKMQKEMARIQEEVKQRVVEGTAGGEMVKVLVNGAGDVVSVKIRPDVVDPGDVEMLEDLVLAATNVALKKSREMLQAEMSKLTGGLGLPGLF